jgi:hypothetical protein
MSDCGPAWRSDAGLVVDGLPADLVVGVKERFGQQVAYVGTAQAVYDASAVTGAFDEAGEAKFG